MISAWPAPGALAIVDVASAPDTLTGVGSGAPGPESASWESGGQETEDDPAPERFVEHRDGWGTARDVGSLIARLVALTWCWTLIWLALWSVVPAIIGWTPTVVTSGSMEPSLPIGSVVQVDDTVDLNKVGAGSVISFDDPGVPGSRVTHRVAGTERAGEDVVAFRTKGDANQEVDTMLVPVANVHGVARLVVPYAGAPKAWAVNGDWLAFGVFFVVTVGAAALSVDTVSRFVRPGTTRRRRRGGRRTAAVAVAVAAMLGAPSTGAAFTATTDSAGSQVSMTSQWFIDAIDRDNPVAHWRLGESPGGAPSLVLADDFETFAGWNNYGAGSVVSSAAQARSGSNSALKIGNNDPNGGWKLLPSSIGNDFVFEVWVYRPASFGGGAIDRVGLEDGSFNGYTFGVDHGGNTLRIDRRTGGSASAIGSSVAFNPPEDQWYRLQMTRTSSAITLTAFDGAGGVLASTTASDATTTAFDRVTVRGGWSYHLDDLSVSASATSTPTVAADRIGTLPGTYVGNPALGQPGLVTSDADTAARFDGIDDMVQLGDSPLINTSARDQRTVELWFDADRVTGRQLLYEEGGTVNGLNVYLDGAQLYATAWSNTSGWSNHLTTIAPAAITVGSRHHVVVTLDAAVTKTLTLYVDGAAVATSTKTDSGSWAAHSDDGGIGALNSDTRFHDGTAQGGGFHFAGDIDEVVIFNSLPTPAHIADHHAAGG